MNSYRIVVDIYVEAPSEYAAVALTNDALTIAAENSIPFRSGDKPVAGLLGGVISIYEAAGNESSNPNHMN